MKRPFSNFIRHFGSPGGAGDPPASVGDPPTETRAAFFPETALEFARRVAPVPSGESPDGTGQWPVPPTSVSATAPESNSTEPPFGFFTRAIAVSVNVAVSSLSCEESLKFASVTRRASGSPVVICNGSV